MHKNVVHLCQSFIKGPLTMSINMSSLCHAYKFEMLSVAFPNQFVLHVQLDRKEKLNAMTTKMWKEMVQCFNQASDDEDVRSIVLSGKGRLFSAGMDLMEAAAFAPSPNKGPARKRHEMYKFLEVGQESNNAIERCMKPVVAAIHGACVGAGVDTVTACDIRMCSENSFFSVKEVDIGGAADLGTLQRLPKIIGNDGLVRELSYTGRRMLSGEALSCGLVSKVYKDDEELLDNAIDLASTIASKNPVAIQSTKHNLNYSRNHSIREGLEYTKDC